MNATTHTPRVGGYFPPFPGRGDSRTLTDAEEALGCRIGIVLWYQWWGTNWYVGRAARQFQPCWMDQAGDRDVLIKWEPWVPGRQVVQPRFAVPTIAAGAHDAYLCCWARRAREWGRTCYLCPLPEPNGFWFQWSTVIGKYPVTAFVAAWRRIHRIFVDEGASNVRWVWAPNAGDMPVDNPMEAYYPGAEYVDILGLSVYNWGALRPWSRWQSFADVLGPYYERIGVLGPQPIWVTEMGCAPDGGDRAAWVRQMFDDLPDFPRLEALLWFNTRKETDWRLTADPAAAAFREGVLGMFDQRRGDR